MKLRLLICASVLCCLAATVRGQVNKSFEADPVGPLVTGWTTTGGTALVSNTSDDLFPSHGAKYLVLSAVGTGPAPVGYGPHAPGTCGQVTQVVNRPAGASCVFSVDWEFL